MVNGHDHFSREVSNVGELGVNHPRTLIPAPVRLNGDHPTDDIRNVKRLR
jgi:hypothetical protein